MKTIGFVDYYLGEWHANNYPDMIKIANEKLKTDYVVKYAWAEVDISPANGVTTDEWCKEYNVEKVDTLEELCEKSDVIVVLAPSDPEKHLEYAKTVLKYSKPTYIDKTFAPNLNEAEEIYMLSEKYNTPFFTTSALRYASELQEIEDPDNAIITGGGSNFNEYVIHTVEMAVVLFKEQFQKVKVEKYGIQRIAHMISKSGKKASIVFSPGMGFSVYTDKTTKNCTSDFFGTLMVEILNFFETGILPFDKGETLSAMALREALLKAENAEGEWIAV